ncbi:transcription antitermination factor NusB [Leucobacter luti]|uniref:Transcription antitermination protein NusB n=1 Tax=Leucobacter luti TaxID=340320 RepID=A0A4V6MCK1_9MICO|nr:transcription antitermination factor NusB [Leucobacter luti]MBL3698067.1 transcription antitermination factor NusB [Leucobacter luti]RZT64849.1 NusB antitermination factor [Leucobacter luti]
MSARTKARKRALDMLYQADLRGESIAAIVNAEAKRAAGEPDRAASWLYAREIVDGVSDHRDEIDELIMSYALGWTLDRMPHLDRALLRMASWEILFNPEVPTPVAIDEAVELAKEYSTDDSGRFVNGVLGRVADHARG